MGAKIPRMDYRQYRAACRLVHECCNYDNGNCILLDNGEPCVCVQSISYSLMCRWFIAAVLPLDGKLEAGSLEIRPGITVVRVPFQIAEAVLFGVVFKDSLLVAYGVGFALKRVLVRQSRI